MTAFAPPLDQTPTFPTMVLVGTLVTVDAPSTVKLSRSSPNIGAADTEEIPDRMAMQEVMMAILDAFRLIVIALVSSTLISPFCESDSSTPHKYLLRLTQFP